MRPTHCQFLFAALLVIAVGCDPAADYQPINLTEVGKRLWGTSLEEVELRTGLLGDLIGSTGLIPEFEIVNRSSDIVAIEGARLITENASYLAHLPGDGELRWRSAAPGSSARISILWEFEDAAVSLLGQRPRIVLDLRIGSERHQVEIEYQRVQ